MQVVHVLRTPFFVCLGVHLVARRACVAQITFDYPFRIPPYFALIIRAIGVLEGIALVGDPEFALVDEAFPYISKRLLTDESPRLRAVRDMRERHRLRYRSQSLQCKHKFSIRRKECFTLFFASVVFSPRVRGVF